MVTCTTSPYRYAGRLNSGVRAHTTQLEATVTTSEILLATAFFPLAFMQARLMLPSFRPPKHRPAAFIAGGVFALTLGTLSAYSLRSDIQSGVVHLSSRRFGEFHADISHQPFEFWCLVLSIYGIGVFLSGFGLAGIGLCFRRTPGRGP